MRYEVCIIKRTTWDITMLTCDVHKPPTQAIRSIFVADYTADELSVRAHSVFLYRSVEQTTGYSARTRSTVSQPVGQPVSQSQPQLVTTHIATGFLQFPYPPYTGCPRRKGPNFGRVFLRSNYTDITQNTYIQSSMVTEILNIEK